MAIAGEEWGEALVGRGVEGWCLCVCMQLFSIICLWRQTPVVPPPVLAAAAATAAAVDRTLYVLSDSAERVYECLCVFVSGCVIV